MLCMLWWYDIYGILLLDCIIEFKNVFVVVVRFFMVVLILDCILGCLSVCFGFILYGSLLKCRVGREVICSLYWIGVKSCFMYVG